MSLSAEQFEQLKREYAEDLCRVPVSQINADLSCDVSEWMREILLNEKQRRKKSRLVGRRLSAAAPSAAPGVEEG